MSASLSKDSKIDLDSIRRFVATVKNCQTSFLVEIKHKLHEIKMSFHQFLKRAHCTNYLLIHAPKNVSVINIHD